MEKLVCTQCGAPINPETLVCDFCGSIFLSSKIETKKHEAKKINVPLVIDSDLKNSIKTYINVDNRFSPTFIIFNVMFIIVAVFILTSVFKLLSFISSAVSMFLIVFIVYATFSSVKNILTSTKLKYKQALDALENNNYEQAYNEFKKLEDKKHDVKNLYAMLLIGFYRLEKFDESRELIIAMDAKELSDILHADINVLSIASLLNIRTPQCHDPNCEKHNH